MRVSSADVVGGMGVSLRLRPDHGSPWRDLCVPNVWPAPDLQVDLRGVGLEQSAVMYPAPEQLLWP
jgi:hypothetical protein